MRANQVQFEGHLDRGNVAVLSRAVPPFDPVSPKIPLNIALAIVFGATLGVAAALLAEMKDRKLREVFDLQQLGGFEVLAVIPRGPKRSRGKRGGLFRRGRNRPLLQAQGT